MNTPRSKPLVRFDKPRPGRAKVKIPPALDGVYRAGLHNPQFTHLIGSLITILPHIEESMIHVMALLLGESDAPARQVFRSLNSEDARIKIMRSLLEHARHNTQKGREFDEIIDLFVEIKQSRNRYAHGLWWTHDETGRAFLEEASPDHARTFLSRREIKIGEINAAIQRIDKFFSKWKAIRFPQYFDAEGNPRLPLPETPRKPRPLETK